jgi:hypothetical protein
MTVEPDRQLAIYFSEKVLNLLPEYWPEER